MVGLKQVGYGREKPNKEPYLPKTIGRMSWTLNPFMIIYEILGPDICKILTTVGMVMAFGFFASVFFPSALANFFTEPIHSTVDAHFDDNEGLVKDLIEGLDAQLDDVQGTGIGG
jgi:hypothetical protein